MGTLGGASNNIVWEEWLPLAWRLTLALVAVLDILSCWPFIVDGWFDSRKQTKVPFDLLFFLKKGHGGNVAPADTCPINSDTSECASSTSDFYMMIPWQWMGLIFCLLCMLEAVIRAKEAKQMALDTQALDNFEKKLANFYTATRNSVAHHLHSHTQQHYEEEDIVLARNTIRFWTPVISILTGWFILIPWISFYQGYGCGEDPSLATLWITQLLHQLSHFVSFVQSQLISWAWDLLLPFSVLRPILLIKRIRLLSRWVRYIRFAGPLLRLILKLQDQFWVFTKTWRQAWQVQMEKAKRLARRSMLFEDIQRIESLTKVQTALASLPSQLFQMAQDQAHDWGHLMTQKQEEGQRLRQRLNNLKTDYQRSSVNVPSSVLYDRIVELTQELKGTISRSFWNANLISPLTRFSVSWRVIVTCALLTELYRLLQSWRLSGTFDITLTRMTNLLLAECEQNRRPIRNWFGKVLPWTKNTTEAVWMTCLPASPAAKFAHNFATLSQLSIDLVCFMDIYVWFFTGEMDMNGVVVPKPFFSRCILPGTLIQILDHPTVPEVLPQLIAYSIDAIRAVGYSRVIRWGLAIYPALNVVLIDPIRAYLFRPLDEAEFLQYTQSLPLMTSFSAANFQSPKHSMSMEPNEIFQASFRSDYGSLGAEGNRRTNHHDDSINLGGYGLYY